MKNNTEMFIQLPFNVFITQFPEFLPLFPSAILQEFMTDSKYIVRLDGEHLEIGYSDDEWLIGSNG